MEVHNHGHHESKKTWKSYGWEFLILFIAVFCGSLAEWQLEHVIENQREKEYIHSMISDLREDVAQTDEILKNHSILNQRMDSLLVELSSDNITTNSNKAYQLWLKTRGFNDFFQNDRTILQLKSSGALRLIRKKGVSDKIMEYDQIVRKLYITQEMFNTFLIDNSMYNQFFDFIKFRKQNASLTPIPLTEKGKKMVNEVYANRIFWKQGIAILIKRNKLVNEEGKKTIEFIKEQYNIR